MVGDIVGFRTDLGPMVRDGWILWLYWLGCAILVILVFCYSQDLVSHRVARSFTVNCIPISICALPSPTKILWGPAFMLTSACWEVVLPSCIVSNRLKLVWTRVRNHTTIGFRVEQWDKAVTVLWARHKEYWFTSGRLQIVARDWIASGKVSRCAVASKKKREMVFEKCGSDFSYVLGEKNDWVKRVEERFIVLGK